MLELKKVMQQVLREGERRPDRTKVGVTAYFRPQRFEWDMDKGFPAVTSKRLAFKTMLAELLWFISGSTNINDLQYNQIWKPWADKNGDLGPVYGAQWRAREAYYYCETDMQWKAYYVDQLRNAIKTIKEDPFSRRIIVDAWNPGQIHLQALPPCHMMFQFDVTVGGRLNLFMYQRSADLFLGVPFNIASYATLLMMVAQVTNLKPGRLIIDFGNAHVYNNARDATLEYLKNPIHAPPNLLINENVKDIDDFTMDDFALVDYVHEGTIKAPVAV